MRRSIRAWSRVTVLACSAFALQNELYATEWFASPFGSSTGTGSMSSPWDLGTALLKTTTIKPGDTLWLRGGTYYYPNRSTGNHGYRLHLTGSSAAPIMIRNYNNERATVDGGIYTNTAGTGHFRIWGLEVIVSENLTQTRTTTVAGSGYSLPRPWGGIDLQHGTNVRLINNVIHDNAQGVGWWGRLGENSEMHGNLIYENGWIGPDRWHGHGIYAQNASGSMRYINDSILLQNYATPMKTYGSDAAYVDNFHVEGNFAELKPGTIDGGMVLIGGDRPSNHMEVFDNVLNKTALQIGWADGGDDMEVIGNHVYRGNIAYKQFTNLVIQDNFKWVPGDPLPADRSPFVSLRPNAYESDRAHLAIQQWVPGASVQIDPSSFLSPGDGFKLMDPKNFYGAPVMVGNYDGSPIDVPMDGNEFRTFVVLKAGPQTVIPPSLTARIVEVDNASAPALAGFKTHDLVIDSNRDSTQSQLRVTLTSGSFYNDASGSQLSPMDVNTAPPNLQFDSWVTGADRPSSAVVGTAGDLGGNTAPGAAAVLNGSAADIAWMDTAASSTGEARLARLSISQNAAGTFRFMSMNAAGSRVEIEGNILDGVMIYQGNTVPGDANLDGIVNVSDLGILGLNWQGTGLGWRQADFNGDGTSDVADLGILGLYWNQTMSGALMAGSIEFEEAVLGMPLAVPEPGTLGGLAIAGAALLLRRRRARATTEGVQPSLKQPASAGLAVMAALFVASTVQGAALVYDDFDSRNLGAIGGQSGWSGAGTSSDAQVIAPGLLGSTQALALNTVNTHNRQASPVNTSELYTSFILNVSSTVDTTGALFASYPRVNMSDPRGCLYIRRSPADASKFNLGMDMFFNAASVWLPEELSLNTNYALHWYIGTGSGSTTAAVWVDPTDITSPLTQINTTGNQIVGSVTFYQDRKPNGSTQNWGAGTIDRLIVGATFLDVYQRTTLPGDLNYDGFVGAADLNPILASWNQAVLPGNPGDIDRNGLVNLSDLNTVLGQWNQGTPPTPPELAAMFGIPEPGVTVAGAAAVLMILRRRRT